MTRPGLARACTLAALLCCLLIPAAARAGAGQTSVTVGPDTFGRPIPRGFVGLSMEYRAVPAFAGTDPTAPNPIVVQLIRNLAPGQNPVLRIGGDSTDWSWWPVPGMRRPVWTRLTLSSSWVQIARALTQATNAKLILGVNLEADNARLAATMAHQLIAGLGSSSVQALELGNEPELYASFGWYHTNTGQQIPGRPSTWNPQAYAHDFANIARSLPNVPLAGPSTGSPEWMSQLGSFLAAQRRLGLVTLHRYPLRACTSTLATAAQLLADSSTTGLADSVAGYVRLAHARGLPLRIGEMGSVACGGAPGVSDAYASTLWALDALFEMARVGVDGVNLHTAPNAVNELFSFTHLGGAWQGYVHPVYYGLMTFAQAAPAGSRLLRTTPPGAGGLKVWATKARDGHIRVLVINKDLTQSRSVALSVPGAGPGTLQLLRAPSIAAKAGITLGGAGFGTTTTTGVLPAPTTATSLTRTSGRFRIHLAPASAALLTL
ncbi:MAG TPA: glycosyl hydrolase family protein [Solirubrobacteraceae bacterium]|nr:glycosyl hydrolase family protein [Solirubrobacteraceae bacterium]